MGNHAKTEYKKKTIKGRLYSLPLYRFFESFTLLESQVRLFQTEVVQAFG